VFGDKDVVLTSFDAVEQGRGVEIVTESGIRAETEIVAIDKARNLAYLRAKRPLGIEPLTESPHDIEIGDAIFAVGRDVFVSGSPKLSIDGGVVVGKRGRTFHSDALSGQSLFVGGPVLDCSGRVVGVGSDRWGDSFVAIREAASLAEDIGVQPEYQGGWSMNHPSVGMVVHAEKNLIGVGLSLGTALIGNDSWYFPVRASALYVASPRTLKTEHTEGFRGTLEAGIGYRIMLAGGELPLYLTPTVGVVGTYERTAHKICADDCIDGDVLRRTTLESFSGAPTAGLAFQFGFGEIGYQLQLNVEQPAASRHSIFIGVQF
jgi:hypothetical protein